MAGSRNVDTRGSWSSSRCFLLLFLFKKKKEKKEVLKAVLRSTAKNNKTHPLLQRSHMMRCGLAASPAGGAGDAICCICSTGSLRRKKTTLKLDFFFLLSSGGSQWSSSLRDLLLDVAGSSVLQVGQSDLLLVSLTGRAAAQHQAPQGCCRLLHRLILSWLEVRDHHHHRRRLWVTSRKTSI